MERMENQAKQSIAGTNNLTSVVRIMEIVTKNSD
jgi:hypothetical protein